MLMMMLMGVDDDDYADLDIVDTAGLKSAK